MAPETMPQESMVRAIQIRAPTRRGGGKAQTAVVPELLWEGAPLRLKRLTSRRGIPTDRHPSRSNLTFESSPDRIFAPPRMSPAGITPGTAPQFCFVLGVANDG
jgi:hypothetical protein